MNKYEFIHNVIKHIQIRTLKWLDIMVFIVECKKNVREVMEKLGKLVNIL